MADDLRHALRDMHARMDEFGRYMDEWGRRLKPLEKAAKRMERKSKAKLDEAKARWVMQRAEPPKYKAGDIWKDSAGAVWDYDGRGWIQRHGPPEAEDFGWALRVMRAGRKVRRACWSTGVSMQVKLDGGRYAAPRFIKDGTGEGAYYWRPLHEDLLAEDWEEFHG